jgi:hypothetical protein
MSDHLAFLQSVAEPAQRRCWLLYRALEAAPLDQAIGWAQRAEEFITGVAEPLHTAALPARPQAAAPAADPPSVIATGGAKSAEADATALGKSTIQSEQRRRLIDRLAAGGKNADLAAEFGLAPKQVQGVRIGCAREIAARRAERGPVRPATVQPAAIVAPAAPTPQPAPIAASVDEVVRYLRQQDDVVVPQGSGEFLVNARFRLPLEELVSRANRIRARQGKPEFTLANGANGHAMANGLASANGHALAKVT